MVVLSIEKVRNARVDRLEPPLLALPKLPVQRTNRSPRRHGASVTDTLADFRLFNGAGVNKLAQELTLLQTALQKASSRWTARPATSRANQGCSTRLFLPTKFLHKRGAVIASNQPSHCWMCLARESHVLLTSLSYHVLGKCAYIISFLKPSTNRLKSGHLWLSWLKPLQTTF